MRACAHFARKVIKFLPEGFVGKEYPFTLMGLGSHKKQIHLQKPVQLASTVVWRKPSKGLTSTTKGKKEGDCGKQANFSVEVAFDKGVVCCEQYTDTLTRNSFAESVKGLFSLSFSKEAKPKRSSIATGW